VKFLVTTTESPGAESDTEAVVATSRAVQGYSKLVSSMTTKCALMVPCVTGSTALNVAVTQPPALVMIPLESISTDVGVASRLLMWDSKRDWFVPTTS
jgi:hypothetical protein